MDDKKLLNGKFTFKSCVVQKKRASLLSENVNRQLAESKEVVGLPLVLVTCKLLRFIVSEIRGLTAMFPANLKKRKYIKPWFNCTIGGILVYVKCALNNFILYRPVCQCWFSIK